MQKSCSSQQWRLQKKEQRVQDEQQHEVDGRQRVEAIETIIEQRGGGGRRAARQPRAQEEGRGDAHRNYDNSLFLALPNDPR